MFSLTTETPPSKGKRFSRANYTNVEAGINFHQTVLLAKLKLILVFCSLLDPLLTDENVYDKVDECILDIRSDRSFTCAQTKEQYKLVIDYALYLLSQTQVSAV